MIRTSQKRKGKKSKNSSITRAYCGQELESRAHIDHLIGIDKGGLNHLSNRVPACPNCNEKEKKDSDWREFLKSKSEKQNKFKIREKRILAWIAQHEENRPQIPSSLREEWQKEVEKVEQTINHAYQYLKSRKDDLKSS